MNIAYIDACTGVSGDMLLAGLINAGYPAKDLKGHLDKLLLRSAYKLKFKKETIHGLSVTRMLCEDLKPRRSAKLKDLERIIQASKLTDKVKRQSLSMLKKLARTEGKIHNKAAYDVHFHEVSGIDTLIDIVGFLVIMEDLGVEKVFCSRIPVGSGMTTIRHGKVPVPVPAVMELLKGIPICKGNISTEIVTPTGALIVSEICESFGEMPEMIPQQVGYGGGSKDLGRPNFLRIIIGRAINDVSRDNVFVMETNVDDLTGCIIGDLYDIMFKEGVLDFYVTPIFMKKNRPAYKLTALVKKYDLEKISEIFFCHTSTFGLRYFPMRRHIVRSKVRTKKYMGERIRIRSGRGLIYEEKWNPEFNDVKKLSRQKDKPLIEIIEKIGSKGHP